MPRSSPMSKYLQTALVGMRTGCADALEFKRKHPAPTASRKINSLSVLNAVMTPFITAHSGACGHIQTYFRLKSKRFWLFRPVFRSESDVSSQRRGAEGIK